ncbi:hypothetical protein HanXRQr2_Chr10g0434901 [Helianthus annuus]|uniref:Uncharacterized protein n=1 Tax=Helianthus annuus TaxID=4232 RepID=A0A9K3HWQ6_HELAN|nr:hypothetical protein HanXRQr2_Chr10g0434901 [Helianthus annuus]
MRKSKTPLQATWRYGASTCSSLIISSASASSYARFWVYVLLLCQTLLKV